MDAPALVDPERALAILYAPPAVRPALTALFALDERLAAVVAQTSEVGIGLIRLAWWREALERLDSLPPPGEPLLGMIAQLIIPSDIGGTALAEMEQGWAALLEDEIGADALRRHAERRGARLFEMAGALIGVVDDRLGAAGKGWAMADVAHRYSSGEVRRIARGEAQNALAGLPSRPWPRPLRTLGALAVLARRDAVSEQRRQGSPGRLARMLVLRATGR